MYRIMFWLVLAALCLGHTSTAHAQKKTTVEKTTAEKTTTAVIQFTSSQKVSNYKWVNVTQTAAYAPRDGAGALVFQGKMWLLGGWNPGDKVPFPRICNNDVWN